MSVSLPNSVKVLISPSSSSTCDCVEVPKDVTVCVSAPVIELPAALVVAVLVPDSTNVFESVSSSVDPFAVVLPVSVSVSV